MTVEGHSPAPGTDAAALRDAAASAVPPLHPVDLGAPSKTLLLLLVGDSALLAVADGWHALHRGALHAQGDAAEAHKEAQ